jgi:hypothetical protein
MKRADAGGQIRSCVRIADKTVIWRTPREARLLDVGGRVPVFSMSKKDTSNG